MLSWVHYLEFILFPECYFPIGAPGVLCGKAGITMSLDVVSMSEHVQVIIGMFIIVMF